MSVVKKFGQKDEKSLKTAIRESRVVQKHYSHSVIREFQTNCKNFKQKRTKEYDSEIPNLFFLKYLRLRCGNLQLGSTADTA